MPEPANDLLPTQMSGHTILVGYGRVGEVAAAGLKAKAAPFVLVELEPEFAARARERGYEVIVGSAADPQVLEAAGIDRAVRLFVAVADGFEGGIVVDKGRKANPALEIVARAHSDAEAEHLIAHGADRVVMGEAEIARAMIEAGQPPEPVDPDVSELAPTAPRLLILKDPERAVLAALRAFDIWPGEAISWAAVHEAAMLRGFDAARIDGALASLRDKDCLRDLGDERVTLTKQGFLAALQPAA